MENESKKIPIGAWVVGILYIVEGGSGLIASLIFLFLGGVGLMEFGLYPEEALSTGAGEVLGSMMFFIIIFIIILIWSVVTLLVGVYILKLRNWARIVATVFSAIEFLAFPVGTIISLVILYFLWVHEETKNAFSKRENAFSETENDFSETENASFS